jgi:alginate O-acetyltransferase complex protein AlgI
LAREPLSLPAQLPLHAVDGPVVRLDASLDPRFPEHKTPLVTDVAMMITMVLGGLWHGAGWTFVIWGALHGIYLVVNHLWIAFRPPPRFDGNRTAFSGLQFSQALTFLAVVVAWVFFRAESLPGAQSMLLSMFGIGAAEFGMDGINANDLVGSLQDGMPILALCGLLVWFAPSTQQIMYRYMQDPEIYPARETFSGPHSLRWRPTLPWAVVVGFLAVYAFNTMLDTVSEFLYFQF